MVVVDPSSPQSTSMRYTITGSTHPLGEKVETYVSGLVDVKGKESAILLGDSRATVTQFGFVIALNTSQVLGFDDALIEGKDGADIEVRGHCSVEAQGNCFISAFDSCWVEAQDSCTIIAHNSSMVKAQGACKVFLYDSAICYLGYGANEVVVNTSPSWRGKICQQQKDGTYQLVLPQSEVA